VSPAPAFSLALEDGSPEPLPLRRESGRPGEVTE